jgi:hypothetical protein
MIIYLYIKQHAITGKKYFGRTTKRNPYMYKGSGSYWTNHIKKYGKEHVKTLDIFGFLLVVRPKYFLPVMACCLM